MPSQTLDLMPRNVAAQVSLIIDVPSARQSGVELRKAPILRKM